MKQDVEQLLQQVYGTQSETADNDHELQLQEILEATPLESKSESSYYYLAQKLENNIDNELIEQVSMEAYYPPNDGQIVAPEEEEIIYVGNEDNEVNHLELQLDYTVSQYSNDQPRINRAPLSSKPNVGKVIDSEVSEIAVASAYNNRELAENLNPYLSFDEGIQYTIYRESTSIQDNADQDTYMEHALSALDTDTRPMHVQKEDVHANYAPVNEKQVEAVPALYETISAPDMVQFKKFLNSVVKELKTSPSALETLSKKVGSIYNPLTGKPAGEYFLKKLIASGKKLEAAKKPEIRSYVAAGKQNVELTDDERKCLKAITTLLAKPYEKDTSSDFGQELNALGIPKTLAKL
ncbi:hypothetical protein HDV01_000602 [Terramyces sp. JEL0728]|nr:hypothetical protein HDV01_000602 [Terramyces sp. JEL0728]